MPTNPSSFMTTENVNASIQWLRKRRAELAQRVDTRLHGASDERHENAGLPRRSEETDDDGAAEAARFADVNALSRIAVELDEVDAALQRVADGSYGECIDCGDPIGAARLDAYPAAQRCTGCQEFIESHRGAARGRMG